MLFALKSRESWSETESCLWQSFDFRESCELSKLPVSCCEFEADACSRTERHK